MGREPLAYRLFYSLPGLSYDPLIDVVRELEPGKLLDIGGGYGLADEILSSMVKEVFMIEVNSSMAVKAFNRMSGLRNVHVIIGDASSLPFPDSSFDMAFFFDSLHHISDREGALREAARVVVRGGYVSIFDFDASSPLTKVLRVVEYILGIKSEFYAFKEMVELLSRLSLEVVRSERGFLGNYILVARKL